MISLIVFSLLFFSCYASDDEDLRRPIDEFSPGGKKVAAWLEHRNGNPEELGDKFEGDILGDIDDIISRNGILGERYRWPNKVIPYEITGKFSAREINLMRDAFNTYARYTCIRFRPRTRKDRDYITITSKNEGCYSYVGRQGGAQVVNFQTPGCTYIGTILHELMHAIGFFHEQSRTDRDRYVIIYLQNVQKGQERNFQKYDNKTVTPFGTPYDYGSIMHYGRTAFSVDGKKPTIVPRDKNAVIGQRNNLSGNDIRKIKLMYKCR